MACFRVGLGALVFALFSASVYAQTAQLSGYIKDPSGASVPAAAITIVNKDNGAKRNIKSNDNGLYVAPLLQPGTYQVLVEASGFQALSRTGITLEVAENARMDFTLQVGHAAEAVNVEEGAAKVNTIDGSVGTTISREFLDKMPLNGRTFHSLITLAPGVIETSTGAGGQFSANGQRASSNYFTIDGTSANIGVPNSFGPNPGAGSSALGVGATGGTNNLVSVDALQEFRIQTSTFSPEYGRAPGAQVQILTRSGTNQFHGSLQEYFRNGALDASDWFANSRGQASPGLRLNDFGGVLGGPLIRDRTFFFFSYEGLRLRNPTFAVSEVPSLATRQGAPSGIRPILDSFPLPNGGPLSQYTAQFSTGYSNPANLDASSVRIDQRFGSRIFLFGRYNHTPSDQATRTPGANLTDVTVSQFGTETLTLGGTATISPTLLNEFRANYSLNGQRSLDVLDTLGGAQPFPDSLVFPAGGSAQTNRTILNLGYSGGAVSLGLRGFFQQRQFNVTDSIAKVFGQHEIKIGVDYLRLFPISQYPVSTLSYTFTGIAQALQGTTTLSNVNQTRTLPILSSVSTYAQDTWHLRSHLAVTYGLRWDYASPLHSSDGHDPLLLQTQAYSSPSQLVHKSQLWQPSYKNFAPRVGIAYSLPEGNGAMTVLRGGFGLFYDTGTGDTWRAYPIGFPDNYRKTTSNIPFPVPAQVAVPFPVDLNNPGTSTLFYFPNSLKSPYSYQWNVTLEQAINSSQSISAGYVGAIGRDLLRQESISVTGGPLIFSDGNDGSSDYHSLQVQYRCHLSFGIQCLASYTFGKSIDTLSNVDAQVPPVSRINSQQDRGLSDFNAAHVFNGAVTVSLPAVKTNTLLKHLTSHWSIDGMVVARSALPVNLLITRDIGFGSTSLRPDLISNVPLYVADPNVAGGRRFNKQAFQTPSAQRQGSLGRNVLAGFPLRQLDAGVQRSFAFRERLTLSTRIEVFNVLNHPNFGPPSGSLTSGLFGISTAMQNQSFGSAGISGALLPAFQSGGPRDLQISMKLQF